MCIKLLKTIGPEPSCYFFSTDLYERQGKAVTNFALTLPAPQSDLAQAVTRDPYNFDFLTIRERYDEKELKNTTNCKIIIETLQTAFR